MSRTRTNFTNLYGTRYAKGTGVTVTGSYQPINETCVDETTLGDNLPFSVTRTTKSGGLINGETPSNRTGHIFTGFPCGYWSNGEMTSTLSIPSVPSTSELASETASRTQPYRPSTTLWEYIDELAGYGSSAEEGMRKKLSSLRKTHPPHKWPLLRGIAKANILTRFAILPLISDIDTLLTFSEAVDKRAKEIERIYGPKGLRRSIDLWEGSRESTSPVRTINSSGIKFHSSIKKTSSLKIRGHIRWYAIFPIKPADQEIRQLAKDAILGFNSSAKRGFGLDPYVFYELMPWSWLIDYFTNLGEVVKASKNLLSVTHSNPRIMRHYRTETSTVDIYDSPWYGSKGPVSCSPMICTVEEKRRDSASVLLSAKSDLLTADQMSILGSLAILRLT